MKLWRLVSLLFMVTSLTQCVSYDLSRRIVQQGNLLPASKIKRLKIGMTKQDVHQLLGSSLVQDVFNPNTVNYAYTWQRGSSPLTIKHVALTFKSDKLAQIKHRS